MNFQEGKNSTNLDIKYKNKLRKRRKRRGRRPRRKKRRKGKGGRKVDDKKKA